MKLRCSSRVFRKKTYALGLCACAQKEGNAHLRLSKAIYNFTDTQDLRLAVGYRATVDEKGVVSGVRRPIPNCLPIVLYSAFPCRHHMFAQSVVHRIISSGRNRRA